MRQPDKAGGKAGKTQRPKTLRRRNAPKVGRKPRTADASEKIALLEHRLNEALEQQTATSEILKVISNSPGHLEPVFNAMLEKAVRICEAKFGVLWLCENGGFRSVAQHNTPPAFAEHWRSHPVVHPVPGTGLRRLAETRQVAHIADMTKIQPYIERDPFVVSSVELGDFRTVVNVPMLKENELAGAIAIYRQEVRPFTEKQIEVVTNFAAQAVIAIENTQLLRELRQSLQQQTATADVLKVISRSTFHLQTVLDTLTESAARLCDADMAAIAREKASAFYYATSYGFPADYLEFVKNIAHPVDRRSTIGRTMIECKPVQISDVLSDPEYGYLESQKRGGFRTMLGVPLLREGVPIGVLLLARSSVRPFSPKQIELVSTFADQAVIAIENTRLFEAEQQRGRELSEALQQQTATADVLKVISRSAFDLRIVLRTLVESAAQLCEAQQAIVTQRGNDGLYRLAASFGYPEEFDEYMRQNPLAPGRATTTGRVALEGKMVHIPDVLADPEYAFPKGQQLGGYRSNLGVPLLRDGVPIGAFVLTRPVVKPFSDKQIELVETFADQAVIAIENVRLLNELRESLQQQTATADVLKVISSSPGELEPVFEAMLANAVRICGAKFGNLFLSEGDGLRAVAFHGAPQAYVEERRRNPVLHPNPATTLGRAMAIKRPVQIADIQAYEPDTIDAASGTTGVHLAKLAGARTVLAVPMVKESELVGAVVIYRQEVLPFTDKQIDLVQNFGAQAVIAVENTRLLKELRRRTDDLSESLEQQTATSEVLQVIASSPTDIQPVLDAILQTAGRLCASEYACFFKLEDGAYHLAGSNNAKADYIKYLSEHPISVNRGTVVGRAAIERRTVHIPDCLTDPEYTAHENARIGKHRSLLGVPLLRDGVPVGVIGLLRTSVKPYTDKQIELVENFAAQAVIAIENARLLNELRELLQQQTATADVLKVISGSAFELQTVFNTLVESAMHLCEAEAATIWRPDGNVFKLSAHCGFSREFEEFCRQNPITPGGRGTVTARVAFEGKIVHVPDVLADPQFAGSEYQARGNYRSALGIPLLRKGETIGVFVLTRADVRPYTDKQIELVKTFAAQAVIAIENVRLFDELRESLQQQTATADVLKVISRSTFDLQTVLNTLVESAARLCDADMASINREKGAAYQQVANYGHSPELQAYMDRHPIPAGRGSVVGRTVMEGKIIHIPDVLADPDYKMTGAATLGGIHTMLGVPLLREGTPIGVIALQRKAVRPFTEKQIELVDDLRRPSGDCDRERAAV